MGGVGGLTALGALPGTNVSTDRWQTRPVAAMASWARRAISWVCSRAVGLKIHPLGRCGGAVPAGPRARGFFDARAGAQGEKAHCHPLGFRPKKVHLFFGVILSHMPKAAGTHVCPGALHTGDDLP